MQKEEFNHKLLGSTARENKIKDIYSLKMSLHNARILKKIVKLRTSETGEDPKVIKEEDLKNLISII